MPCLHVTSTALTAESVATSASSAVASLYAQCGGVNWTGATSCVSGAYCLKQNDYYYQCVAGTATSTSAASTSTTIPASLTTTISHSSATSAVSSARQTTLSTVKASSKTTAAATSAAQTAKVASTTTKAAAVPTSATTVAVVQSSTSKATTTPAAAASTTTAKAASTTTTAASTSSGLTQWAGVNIAGFDFGCGTDGTCTVSGSYGPIASNGINGTAQMVHFYNDDKLNIFRLPVGWQYLTNAVVGGDLDSTYFGNYDELMQGCLATGAYCVIDIHNYARWDGEVIGQGGPTNDEFAALWSSLATKYKSESKVIFGVMNEPHDLTVSTWADTVQAAVTAIRDAGATSQYISLPGSDYASAGSFISDGSAAALLSITNPDGTTDKLIFDVHKYLDSDNSGTSTECVTSNTDAFSTLATWLRSNNRQAILSETGGGNTASCEQYVCEELAYLNENSDVFMGYIGWAAGSFASSYALTLTPDGDSDTALMTACFSRA